MNGQQWQLVEQSFREVDDIILSIVATRTIHERMIKIQLFHNGG